MPFDPCRGTRGRGRKRDEFSELAVTATHAVDLAWAAGAAERERHWLRIHGDAARPPWLAGLQPTHLHFGSEFCEHLLPSEPGAARGAAAGGGGRPALRPAHAGRLARCVGLTARAAAHAPRRDGSGGERLGCGARVAHRAFRPCFRWRAACCAHDQGSAPASRLGGALPVTAWPRRRCAHCSSASASSGSSSTCRSLPTMGRSRAAPLPACICPASMWPKGRMCRAGGLSMKGRSASPSDAAAAKCLRLAAEASRPGRDDACRTIQLRQHLVQPPFGRDGAGLAAGRRRRGGSPAWSLPENRCENRRACFARRRGCSARRGRRHRAVLRPGAARLARTLPVDQRQSPAVGQSCELCRPGGGGAERMPTLPRCRWCSMPSTTLQRRSRPRKRSPGALRTSVAMP